MRTIEIRDKSSLQAVAQAMKNKEKFVIATSDKDFKPLGYDKYSAELWIGAAGGGVLMAIGGGALALAFLDPEPTSKLGALVTGGILITLAGGGVLITILVTRSRYQSSMKYNNETGQYEWTLEPK